MVAIPLIGLLGGLALRPQYENYKDRTRGRYQERALQGVDRSDPNAVAGGLFNAGLINGSEFRGDIRGAHENQLNRQNTLDRANISAAPSWARIQMEREQQALQIAQTEALQQQKQAEREWLSQFGTPAQQQILSNPNITPKTHDSVLSDIVADVNANNGPSVDMQNEFIATTQADLNTVNLAEYGMGVLDEWGSGLTQPDYLTSPEGARARSAVNQILWEQKQAEWSERRSDAPGDTEREELDALFPMLTPTTLKDEKKMAIIRQNLENYRNKAVQRATARRDAYTRTGHAPPNVQANNILPDYWSRED